MSDCTIISEDKKPIQFFIEEVPCQRKPQDLDQGVADGSGELEANAQRWSKRKKMLINVWITASGDYATWDRKDLISEVSQIFNY